MALLLRTPLEAATGIAQRVRAERLGRGWTQPQLAQRAGLPVATYRLFERSGKISLHRLLAIVSALGRLGEWDALLRPAPTSLDAIDPRRPVRQRGRRAPSDDGTRRR
ncbi:MAG: helix-turn-helix domain-containing protein [Gemmatimonadaceae bacterium]